MDFYKEGINAYKSEIKNTPEILSEGFQKLSGKEGIKKAAKLLLLVGKEQAAEIIRHLKPDETELIVQEIAQIKQIRTIEAEKILDDFNSEIKNVGDLKGGVDTAFNFLEKAFGTEKGKAVLSKSIPTLHKPFSYLKEMELPLLSQLLKGESLVVICLLVPYMDKLKAARYLETLSDEDRIAIIKRISTMGRIDKNIIRSVDEKLKDKYRLMGTEGYEAVNGPEKLAGILKEMSRVRETDIINTLKTEKPELSESVTQYLMTPDMILKVLPHELAGIISDLSNREIVYLIKVCDDSVINRFEICLSGRRWKQIQEEIIFSGPVKRNDADAVLKKLLDTIRNLYEKGEIQLSEDDDEWVY